MTPEEIAILEALGIGAIIGGGIAALIEHYLGLRTQRETIYRELVNQLIPQIPQHMFVIGRVSILAEYLEKVIKEPNNEEVKKEAFYYLAFYLAQDRYYTLNVGAYFFKTLNSEDKAYALHDQEYKILDKWLTSNERSKILISTDLNELYINFLSKLDKDAELQRIFGKFKTWLVNKNCVQELIDCLRCYADFVTREINLMLEPWYRCFVDIILCRKKPEELKREQLDYINGLMSRKST